MGSYGAFSSSTDLATLFSCIGVTLGVLYYLAAGINFAFFYSDSQPGSAVYTWIAIIIYSICAVNNLCLCRILCKSYTNRFFNFYNTFAILATLCLFIDACLFYPISGGGAFIFFGMFLVSSLCFFVTCIAKNDLQKQREAMASGLKDEQESTVVTTGESDMPKFEMAIHVETAEFTSLEEPMNKHGEK